jgi:hypothetical protein
VNAQRNRIFGTIKRRFTTSTNLLLLALVIVSVSVLFALIMHMLIGV